MDRRDFMRASTAAAVGGLSLSSVAPLRAQAPTSDALRIGLIGCGGRGTG
ncbi:MAG: twin-arginine translocation signal domain-containing protein, partial [Gemmatimonadales bacterium]|nr:twin-arginine translocation signal domain-containing protein [Gemmatimonadales bacterium]